MKLAHISDLHLGIRICEVKMLDEQRYILKEIIKILKNERPDALLLSGDIYDRPIPPEEAVDMLDEFLSEVNRLGIALFIISGNHDSPERIDFGTALLESADVFVAGKYDGKIKKVTKEDEYGKVNFYLLPFIKPSYVNNFLPEDKKIPDDYETAVRTAVNTDPPDTSVRNVILSHQFVQGATRSDSEEVLVGYIDSISADVFKDFDYAALGHLHKAQKISRDTIRYCGTPLKYSFAEEKNIKSVTFIDMKEKGNITLSVKELKPQRDVKNIKGSFAELMEGEGDDYTRAVLTDDTPIPNAFNRLRERYPFILKLEYEKRLFTGTPLRDARVTERKTVPELFEEFFKEINNKKLKISQKEIIKEVLTEISEERNL